MKEKAVSVRGYEAKTRWRVVTDCGTIETVAASVGKAKQNAKYRLAMRDRAYGRPGPSDFARMRDIEVIRCEEIG